MSAMEALGRLLILFWLALAAGPAVAADNALHFVSAERLILPVTRAEFQTPPKLQEALPDAGWQHTVLPDASMSRTDVPEEGKIQTTWYRFALSEAIAVRRDELFFYLPRWQTVGQVALYGDGRLLWHSRGDTVWNGFNQPVWVSLDPPGQPRPREILLRMDSVPGLGAGISSAWVGTEAGIAWRYYIRTALQVELLLFTCVAFLLLGVFSISVWWRRRHESLYLLSFIASLSFIARYLNYLVPLDTAFVSSAWFGWISMNAVSWLAMTILIFNFKLCGRRYRWLERIMLAGVALQGILSLPLLASSAGIVALAGLAYWFIILMAIPACLLALHASWRGNSISGLVLALISLCSLLLGMHDIRMHNYQISLENIYLLPLSQIGFFIVFAFIIRHRYLEGVESLERSREVLAQRLREREAELADSYARLREVERRELLSHERQRLMHDMHDGLGGSLAGMLRMMERDDCNTDGLKAALQECIDELRLTIDSLEPLESDVSVLLAGLRFRLQPRLEAAGIRLVWRVEALPLLPWLTPSHAMHVMRIVQEVVTNVVKHAEAREMVFSTQADAAGACIRIEDDGKGFAGEAGATGGHGLRNIRYRAALLGASVRWQARATADGGPAGTCFTFLLPLAAPAATVADPH